METISALLALCAGNSLVTGEFPAQRPAMRSFDVFFDLRLNKRLGKQARSWWLETPSGPLWRHSDCSCDLVSHLNARESVAFRYIEYIQIFDVMFANI